MSASIALRSLVSVIVLPGVAALLIPWLIVGAPGRPEGVAWLGLVPLVVDVRTGDNWDEMTPLAAPAPAHA